MSGRIGPLTAAFPAEEGDVVMVVLSWIAFATVLGGGVAGYLHRGTRMEGARVGAVSGLIAAIPVFGVLALVFSVISFGSIIGGRDPESVEHLTDADVDAMQ